MMLRRDVIDEAFTPDQVRADAQPQTHQRPSATTAKLRHQI